MVLLIKLSKDVRETRRTKFMLRYIKMGGLFAAGRKNFMVVRVLRLCMLKILFRLKFFSSIVSILFFKKMNFSWNEKYFCNSRIEQHKAYPTPPSNNLATYLVNNLPTRYNFQFNKFENFSTPYVFRLLHLIRKAAKPGLWFIKLTICFLETSLTKKQHNENKEPGEKRRKRN